MGLAFFLLAGSTGAFFRFGIVTGWTGGLQLGNLRHAHLSVFAPEALGEEEAPSGF